MRDTEGRAWWRGGVMPRLRSGGGTSATNSTHAKRRDGAAYSLKHNGGSMEPDSLPRGRAGAGASLYADTGRRDAKWKTGDEGVSLDW